MRLRVSRNAAEERLVALMTEGHFLRSFLWKDYQQRKANGTYDDAAEEVRFDGQIKSWVYRVQAELKTIFPTLLELHAFSARSTHDEKAYKDVDQTFGVMYFQELPLYQERLKDIRDNELPRYTDLPQSKCLYVEDVDSFQGVRDVNPKLVEEFLSDGLLNLSEDSVQLAIEQILDVPFHKKDWAGELCDLYTANVVLNGRRRLTAFLLKGRGIGKKEMTIADCGKNGDQLVRLLSVAAELFVVQYVGPISEYVVKDAEVKLEGLRSSGREANLLIIDGQDTARLLHAYGKLEPLLKK